MSSFSYGSKEHAKTAFIGGANKVVEEREGHTDPMPHVAIGSILVVLSHKTDCSQ